MATSIRRQSLVRQLTDDENSFDCPLCTQPNIADKCMVQCDVCQCWIHFSCAGVDETIRNSAFTCAKCAPPLPDGSRSGRSTSSSVRAARRQLELQRLSEEKALQERLLKERQEEEEAMQKRAMEQEQERKKRAMQEKLELERQYIEKKFELLHAELDEDDDDRSVRSHRSNRSIRRTVQEWVKDQEDMTLATGTGIERIPTGPTSNTGTLPKRTSAANYDVGRIVNTSHVDDQTNLPATGVPSSGHDTRRTINFAALNISPPSARQKDMMSSTNMVISPPVESTNLGNSSSSQLIVGEHQLQRNAEQHQQQGDVGQHQPALQNVSSAAIDGAPNRMVTLASSQMLHQGRFETAPLDCNRSQANFLAPPRTTCGDFYGRISRPPQLGIIPKNPAQKQFSSQPLVENNTLDTLSTTMVRVLPPTHQRVTSVSIYSYPITTPMVFDGVVHGQNVTSVSQTVSAPSAPRAREPGIHSNMVAPAALGRASFVPPGFSGMQQFEVPSTSIQPLAPLNGPTPQQIAARHVVPKDLPVFSGDPTEWPLFASSYYNSTAMCGYSDGENLMRLQRSLKGSAREAVHCHLLHPSSVPQIMMTLQTLFGRPELIVRCLLNKVQSTPAPKADKLETLISFGLAVQNLCSHLQSMGMEAHMTNPTLLQELIEKLPTNLKLDWALHQRQLANVDLRSFGDYMSTIVFAASEVSVGSEPVRRPEKPKGKEKDFLNAHSKDDADRSTREERKISNAGEAKVPYTPKPCPICKRESHKVKDCSSFLKASIDDRWKLAHQANLCKRCLIGHGKWPCKATVCGSNGCELRHHKLLHPGKPESSVIAKDQPKVTGTVGVHRHKSRPTLFRIIPVTIHANGTSIRTLAFLDDGSSYTLIEQDLAEELGVTGELEPLCLQWTSGITRTEVNSRLLRMEISGVNAARKHVLEDVRTVEKLDLPPQSLRFQELADKYEYLRGLPVASYDSAAPRILIGVDNANLLVTLKKREGKKFEPVATKTRLGWTIYGIVEGFCGSSQRLLHICARSSDDELHEKVNEFFSVESVGVAVISEIEAEDDRRARSIMEETTIRTPSGRYQTGWRYDYVEFPESWAMAEQRLKCLERKLSRNPELYNNVKQQIVDYQLKGYAHELTEEERSSSDPRRVWYLPLGVVTNPNKPGKVRVVWDAAAKVDGISFNSMLMKGPDLTTSLTTVLYRFRQRQIAIAGDIKEMFHQIQIRPQDRQAQRFLWRDGTGEPLKEYVMDVATFGSTCSPSSAQFVKNRNAEEWSCQYPEAAIAITESHYVDDYLDSLDSEEEAVKLALDVKTVHAKAGFEIRNWLSNSEVVIQRVGDPGYQIAKKFTVGKGTETERVLGMSWTPNEDTFTFAVNFRSDIQSLINGTSVPTKRQVLRVVMSVFDPLGLVAAFVIHGKCLVQDIWRTKIGWDEPIPTELHDTWRRWIQILQQLPLLKLPRCYFPNYNTDSLQSLQLHVFVDASETAYSCVAYFRIIDQGKTRCVLVSSKTKVAPLKPMSIPRLELQAAVIGTRLMKSVQQSHTLPICRRVIWTDSRTVLSWIQSDQRKYRQFVAFRVSEILEETKLDEWRWIPSRLNVADEATKWGNGPNLGEHSRWFCGPGFLYNEESEWPTQELPKADTAEEQRPVHAHHRATREPLVDFQRFSNLQRLIRTVAFVRRFIAITRKTFAPEVPASAILSRLEIQEAEFTLWRWVQAETFTGELRTLRDNQQLQAHQRKRFGKNSPLRKLSCFLDDTGVIRLDGRLQNAPHASYSAKFPVVLPKDHYFTGLLVSSYHRRFAHGNGQTVVNEIRQKFHISSLRIIVRQIAKQCSWCTVYKAGPRFPKMAPLPEARVTPYVRAFTHIGIDYCGPFSIRVRRYEVKKWVMLVTCLTVRAVHLEVVGSLSTEACKMAIRSFIARRGSPLEIYSDQGTNFVGASRELKEEIASINRDMAGTFTNADTQWRFNPPATPHMGGVWERLVRSVKTALRTISSARKPDEETFYTYLTEVESIVNSRPLTHVPLEHEDGEALTPNHFLLLSSSGVVQPTQSPVVSGSALRANWSQIQHLLDLFWSKWTKEYLPTINCRSKWLTDTKPLQPGDLVMVVDSALRNSWKRGKIVRIYYGSDGVVRRADVQTANGLLQRSVTGLVVLEVMNSSTAAEGCQQYGSGNVRETDHPATLTSVDSPNLT